MSLRELKQLDAETLEYIQEYSQEELEDLTITIRDAIEFHSDYHQLTERQQDALWRRFER